MKTDKLRSLFLDYFKARNHRVFSSDSLVPAGDPTLLFTGAGMNQFKPYFLGEKKDVKRAASCQKCLRTADLERVGETAYHHTFFEMLGNFSFGDYFKEEAIQYAWDFVTRELAFRKEELWVSVFEKDDEAFTIWKKKIGIDEKRIKRLSAADNFWPANAPEEGPNGPCGPCSEIYVGAVPGKGVEIWNLVFTQYDRQEDGFLKPLPQKNIDTGLGLERLAAVMQRVPTNFDIDAFKPISESLAALAGETTRSPAHRKIRNAVLDHIRAVVFTVADGVMPANEGRGYVVRKLIRKSALHLREFGHSEPLLHLLVPAVAEAMQDAYPELKARSEGIASIIRKEEEGFWSVVETRLPQAEIKIRTIALTSASGKTDSSARRAAELAFEFYDTYGVPKELLRELVIRSGLPFDDRTFSALADHQRDRSRAASSISQNIFTKGAENPFKETMPPSEFVGYETLSAKAKILGLALGGRETECVQKGQKAVIALDRTPFYAEQGGQVGDVGEIAGPSGKAAVKDTQWHERVVFHIAEVTEGVLKKTDGVTASVNAAVRQRTIKNHTATHLAHSALRKVLGPHVKQSGSLVAPDRLRFDFTHFGPLKPEEIIKVETLVNAEIRKHTELRTRLMNTREAIANGAMAFFGEKYGDQVRVVSAGDFSTELCGGTHVANTGQIGLFRIIGQSAVQAGVRRIEAVTGEAALAEADEADAEVARLALYLGSSRDEIASRISSAVGRVTNFQKKLRGILKQAVSEEIGREFKRASTVAGARVVVCRLPAVELDLLREAADALRSRGEPCVILLAARAADKTQVVVALSKDLVGRGIDANALVKEIAGRMDGSGGGRPDLAVGGGRDPAKLESAIAFARDYFTKGLER